MKYLLIYIFILSACTLNSQYNYKNYGIKQGLIQASNYYIKNDSIGYLWLSSEEGLSKFDGRKFENYYYNPLDSQSLYGSYINNFIEIENSSLIVASSKGLCYYNRATNKFKKIELFSTTENKIANSFIIDKTKNEIIVFDDLHGLFTFNYKNNNLKSIDSAVQVPSQYLGFSTVKYDAKNKILFFSNKNGIVKYNVQNKSKEYFLFSNNNFALRNINAIFSLVILNDSTLITGTNNGVAYIDSRNNKILKQLFLPVCSKQEVYAVGIDLDTSIWVGSNCGIIYRIDNNKLQPIKLNFENEEKINLKDIMFFHFTKDNIFVNEDNVGLGIIKRNRSYLNSYNKKNNKSFFLNEQSIFSFAEKKDNGNILVGKFNNGILIYNTLDKSLSEFEKLYNVSLDGLTIKSLFTKNNITLICTTNGLLEFDLKTKKLISYSFANSDFTFESKFVNHILELSNGNIIIGTKDGIFKVDRSKKTLFKISFQKENAYFLYENKNHQLLTTSESNNLSVYTIENEKLNFSGSFLNSFAVMNVWEDTLKNQYWFATREGILHTNDKFEILNFLNSKNGLKSSSFYGILPDGLGHLWCSSNRGIATININDYSIYYYFTDDELSGLEYNGKSFFKSTDGLLYFGSETGFDIIDPNSFFKKKFSKINIVEEDFLINNIKADNKILENLINNKIILQHKQNNIAIKLNLVNYENDFPLKLYYKLENLQEEWIELEPGGWIRLSNLKPKEYKILIKTDEKYYKLYKELIIIIKPAWYQTILFKVLVVIAIAGLLYILYAFRVRQLKKIITIRSKISADLHDDIGSTLSTINMYSQVAQLQPNSTQHITTIQENTKEVLEKLDDIVWATNPKNDKIENLIERIENFVKPLLKAKQVNLIFNYNSEIKFAKINEATRQTVFLIIKEAINNMVKYADAKNCTLQLLIKNKNIYCTITDDGKGFDTTKPTERNGLLNMQNRTTALKGKFAINSTINKGTSIQLRLPL